MKAVHLLEFGKFPTATEIPIPVPSADEVLVSVKASPINPSDLMYI